MYLPTEVWYKAFVFRHVSRKLNIFIIKKKLSILSQNDYVQLSHNQWSNEGHKYIDTNVWKWLAKLFKYTELDSKTFNKFHMISIKDVSENARQ